MGTETLYPNSANGAAWLGVHTSYPGTALTDFQDTAYTSGQKNTVSTDDNNYVAVGNDEDIPGHRVKYVTTQDRANVTRLDLTSKTESGDPDVKLYIWNFTTGAWVLLDTDGGPGKLTFTGSVTAGLTNYIDASGTIQVLIVEVHVWELWHYFSKVEVTYAPPPATENVGGTVLVVTGGADSLSFKDDAGTTALAVTAVQDLQVYLTEALGTSALAVTAGVDAQAYLDALGTIILALGGSADAQNYIDALGTVALALTGGQDSPSYLEALGTVALAATGCVDALAWADHSGTVVLVLTAGVDAQAYLDALGSIVLAVSGSSDAQSYLDVLGTLALAVTGGVDQKWVLEGLGTAVLTVTGGTDEVLLLENVGSVVLVATGGLDLAEYVESLGTAIAALTAEREFVVFPVSIRVPAAGMRELKWDGSHRPEGTVYAVTADGRVLARTAEQAVSLADSTEVRQYLLVILDDGLSDDELREWLPSPRDVARLAWSESEGAAGYRLYRKSGAGAYTLVTSVLGLSYDDDPLPDGAYTYKVVAYDEEGDTADSNEQAVTVSSAPEPPTGLEWTWDPELQKLTLAWNASPSADVASYRVRSSAGSPWLGWQGVPVQDSADLTYEQAFTDQTGTYIFSVRAVDADGIEEGNVRQVVSIPFEGGAPVAQPAEARLVSVRPIAGGKIELEWLYDPRYEDPAFSGAAYEARIYWDAGTGTVDFEEPLAAVAIGRPTAMGRWSWQSDALEDGQTYLFVVRIATQTWADGTETNNTGTHGATPGLSVPVEPILTAAVL
jgi:hypothetical protein